ncbi:MAG: SurA N-terminal domain-containing protein [Candidatus Pacebacteria bacterium]|nr:SurA N-terminal domain-containing protein [Candidatus Paceibacterota bacterium]
MQQKTLIAIVIGALIVIAGAYYYFTKDTAPSEEINADTSSVVARVNGVEITQNELDAYELKMVTDQQIDKSSLDEEALGQLKTQALDGLVVQSLLEQAVKKDGTKVSKSDVDKQIETIKGNFENEEAYQSALSTQGTTEDILRTEIERDLVIQKYLEKVLDLESITVSEEEIQALYDQESAVNENLAELSEVSEQIKAFIIQQKQQELFAAYVQELKADAEIEILNQE